MQTEQLLEADILQAGFLADFAADSSEVDFCADLEDAFEVELAFEAEHFEVGPHLEAVFSVPEAVFLETQ